MTIEFTVPVTEFSVPHGYPRRGNWLTGWLARLAMRITGWSLAGSLPSEGKFIAVAAPHRTAMYDFSIGIMTMYTLGVRFSFMIKHSVVRWPIGGPIRWLGGIPINRSAAHGVVQQVADEFSRAERLIIAITPEGTRSRAGVPVLQWKRGFYHIASRAGVSIVPIYVSYTHRRVVFGKAFFPTGDFQSDMEEVQLFYDHNSRVE